MNAAPNEGSNIDFGFGGVTLTYGNTFSETATVNADGVAAGRPLAARPPTTPVTGSSRYRFRWRDHQPDRWRARLCVRCEILFGLGFVALAAKPPPTGTNPRQTATPCWSTNWKRYVANTQTAAVPEPETYALIIAGLGVVGAALRRRKTEDAVAA